MKKNHKFLVAGLVIIAAIGYLVFVGVKESSVYFMTVAELKVRAVDLSKDGVRISGSVIEDSIEYVADEMLLKFRAKDEEGPDNNFIYVTYKGIKPDSFKADAQVILEGKYSIDDNLFKATTLLVKCPSRYEGETPPPDYNEKNRRKIAVEGA